MSDPHSINIEGDRNVVARDVAGNIITGTVYYQLPPAVPPDYRHAIRRMIDDYTAIFGGRDSELAELDAWLDDDSHPFAFLHSPTGRGKTALFIHWIIRVQQRNTWNVFFVPISL